MKVIIYTLVDPRSIKVRYIGITSTSLGRRLYKHLDESRYGKRKNHRINWIRNILSSGFLPIIRKIGEVDSWERALEIERCLIEKHKKTRGLVNYEDYIDGERFGKSLSIECKKKISESLKNYFKKNKSSNSKCIEVYNLEAEKVGTFASLVDCAKNMGMNSTNICGVLKKKIRQYRGYIFRYCDDESEVKKLIDYNPKKRVSIAVKVTDVWSKEIIEFKSLTEAAIFFKVTIGTMSYIKNDSKKDLFRYRYKMEFYE